MTETAPLPRTLTSTEAMSGPLPDRRPSRWLGGDSRETLIGLFALGCVIEVFLIFLLQRFWLPSFFPGPGYSVGFPQMMSGSWASGAWWLTAVLAAPWLAYVPAVLLVQRLHGPAATAIVFGFALLFGLTLVGLYPITASDLFHYAADGRTLWTYHDNPMVVAPQAHYYIIAMSWMQQPSPYGPLWQILSAIPAALAGEHWVAEIVLFKLMTLGFTLASIGLVYQTLQRFWPERALLGALLFGWSPFVLLRAVGNGHNDIVMMAFALGCVYFVLQQRWRWAMPLLALSIMVKFSTALLVPPIVVYAWFASDLRGRKELLIGCAAGAGLAALITAPFWVGFDTFQTFVQNTNLVITAVPQLVVVALKGGDYGTAVDPGVRTGGYIAFGAVYLVMLLAVARRPRFEYLPAVLALTFIAYLTLCTWWFRPWYLLWFLPLAALLPTFWWTVIATGTAFGATFFDLVEQYRVHWPWVWDHVWRSYATPVATVFLPMLFLLMLALAVTGSWNLHTEKPDLAARARIEPEPRAL